MLSKASCLFWRIAIENGTANMAAAAAGDYRDRIPVIWLGKPAPSLAAALLRG